MKRTARWALLSIGIAGAVMVATGAPSFATPPSGLTNIPLARGSDTSHGTIRLHVGTDIAMAQITVNPGGSSGWHSHPGARSSSSRRARSPSTPRTTTGAGPPITALGRRSSNGPAKWMTCSTPAPLRMFST